VTVRPRVVFSPIAIQQIAELADHCREKRRPEAIVNLEAAMVEAETMLLADPNRARPFPATYRELYRAGTAWITSGSYRVAYRQIEPPEIGAVYWDRAAIDRRHRGSD